MYHKSSYEAKAFQILDADENVKTYYPEYWDEAMKTAETINAFYGRNKEEFYAKFGRDLGQDTTCEYCKF